MPDASDVDHDHAAVEGLTLVSRDESIARYDVDILKA